ncbi:hypothetical protein ES705_25917 [subsurface metagenome]
MNYLKILFITYLLIVAATSKMMAQQNDNLSPEDTIRFVSFPDFFNFDIPEPWPKYDTAINYFF